MTSSSSKFQASSLVILLKSFSALRRCLFSPSDTPILFSDVVFADIATSFARVLGDVWLSLVMLLPGHSLLLEPSEIGWYQWILPTIMRCVFPQVRFEPRRNIALVASHIFCGSVNA